MIMLRPALIAIIVFASAVATHAAAVRAPRDSPVFGRGRIQPSPPVPRTEPVRKEPRPSAGCAPLVIPDPGYRPIWVPESSCWNGFQVERVPGHWIWTAP